jgi:two-component system, CitB family, sensor kinase
MRRGRRLSTQILVGQLVVLAVALLATLGLRVHGGRGELDRQFEQRALAVASSVASLDEVRSALAAGDPHHVLQPLAERVRRATGTSYVVVADRRGIRFSHPNRSLIGKRVSTQPDAVLTGSNWVGVQTGTLGRSARGKAPIRGHDGRVIGEVSVGILESQVSNELWRELPNLLLYTALALSAGAIVSLVLTRRLKQQTLGLELAEIAELLQEREAMLHGISEGVITMDTEGRVSLVNDEARRLLNVGRASVGDRIADLVPPGRLRDLLTGATPTADDEVVLTDDRSLTVSRMPVSARGRVLGAVVTMRDRTELVGLLRELDSVRALTDALRAQQHEHANRMHTTAGLLELGRVEDAMAYLMEISTAATALAETLRDQLGDPTVVALLLAKVTIAAERGVTLRVEAEGDVAGALADPRVVGTIVGNLVDNAIDAVAGRPDAWVVARFCGGDRRLRIVVSDNGPGVPDEALAFRDGYSTKAPRSGMHRGLGLALVRRLAGQAGGTVSVANDGGAVLTVELPAREVARAAALAGRS